MLQETWRGGGHSGLQASMNDVWLLESLGLGTPAAWPCACLALDGGRQERGDPVGERKQPRMCSPASPVPHRGYWDVKSLLLKATLRSNSRPSVSSMTDTCSPVAVLSAAHKCPALASSPINLWAQDDSAALGPEHALICNHTHPGACADCRCSNRDLIET